MLRDSVFKRVRDPDATTIEWDKMPRGSGDNYRSSEKFEDSELPPGQPPAPNSLFTLTRVQYAVLREWKDGNFENDWPGAEPQPVPEPSPSPDQLDKAAVDAGVGGPFYPGIDCGWLIRV